MDKESVTRLTSLYIKATSTYCREGRRRKERGGNMAKKGPCGKQVFPSCRDKKRQTRRIKREGR